ncbi:MAG: glucose-6-phosphate isomerase [Clostridia bacterium]|nr:glucose-6-phosphate isomerase [Clostridia bacterium]
MLKGDYFMQDANRLDMQISIDFNNMMERFVGEHGIGDDELNEFIEKNADIAQRVNETRDNTRWRELPYNQETVVNRILEIAESVRKNYHSFVVLGIGGSALGPIAVQKALNHLRYNELSDDLRRGPKLYIEDNIDPERIRSLFDVIDIKRTMFNVITKSGSTSETMAQLLLITYMLRNCLGDNWANHVIATTDEHKGNLVKIARQFGITTLYVPDGVGGRFSELSPVGLLPAAVCGIDIKSLLDGAAYMDKLCSVDDPQKNPAFMLAALECISMKKGCNISVMMPYADSLKEMADWYAQLWAESLGKLYDKEGCVVRTGQTPVKALGVTDQHSQIQLYAEGPFDKVITFLAVDQYRALMDIPNAYDDIPDVAFLSGHTFNELIDVERRATEYALMKSRHMSKTITLPMVNEFTIGQLMMLLELQTAYAGGILNIDAFDQPGVEEGKNATYALLGKPGYEEKALELKNMPKKMKEYML